MPSFVSSNLGIKLLREQLNHEGENEGVAIYATELQCPFAMI